MAQDIMTGLFGLSPYQVEQQNQQKLDEAAYRYAQMPAAQRGAMDMYRGAAGIAGAVGGMLGYEDKDVMQAKTREQALTGLDISSPESILQKAAQVQDPRIKLQLQMIAKQRQEEMQKAQLEAKKIEREDFRMGQEFEWRKEQKLEELRQRERESTRRSEDTRLSIAERTAAQREANQIRLLLGQMANAIAQQKIDAKAGEAKKLTKGQEAVDREFGKEYAEYVAAGGFSDVAKQVKQLEQVQSELEKKGNDYTGPAVGLIPDKARAFTNPAAVSAKNKVEEVAQRNLRLVLGAQFTQVEGERLIARAYNPSLPPEENAARVKALAEQIKTAAKQKAEAADYFEKNGTLSGWSGKLPSITDFEEAIDRAGGSKTASGRVSAPPLSVAAQTSVGSAKPLTLEERLAKHPGARR